MSSSDLDLNLVWNQKLQIALTTLVGFHLFLLASVVPGWVMAVASVLLGWKFLTLTYRVRAPSRAVVSAMGAAALAAVWITHKTLLGEEAATAGLAMVAGCKLLESNRYRDVLVSVILCFVLLMTHLIYSQTLTSTFILGLDVFLILQFLLQLHPSNISLFSFKVVGRLLGYIVPIWFMFFIVFPRFSVGFWQRDNPVATSGFSEDMNPGAVSQLVLSNQLAFRVQFEDASRVPQKPEDWYFRGATLSVGQGLRWSKTPRRIELETPVLKPDQAKDPGFSYQVYLEPLFQKWLFVLDPWDETLPVEVKGLRVQRRHGSWVESGQVVISRVQYAARARAEPAEWSRLTDLDRDTHLQLPTRLEPEVQALVQTWKKEWLQELRAGNESVAQRLTQWFRDQKFQYTLEPGVTPSLATFLFRTRSGFCEHFAAAGATLLRAMGVPARVVVGFQGAEKNQFSDYWIVRSRNAHAWIEYWQPRTMNAPEGPGAWKRLDLVQIAAPMRLSLGTEFFQYPVASPEDIEKMRRSQWLNRSMLKFSLAIDALEMRWIQFLLDYDYEFQRQLWSKLGIGEAKRSTLFTVLGLLLLVAGFGIWLRIRRNSKGARDPLGEAWTQFKSEWRRSGVDLLPHWTVEQTSNELQTRFPQYRERFREWEQLFSRVRYRQDSTRLETKRLQDLFRELQPRKLKR